MVPKVEQQVCTTVRQETEQDVTQDYRDATDTVTLDQKYSNFGWNQDGIQRDDQIQITSPDGEDPTIHGTINIATGTGPIWQKQGAKNP